MSGARMAIVRQFLRYPNGKKSIRKRNERVPVNLAPVMRRAAGGRSWIVKNERRGRGL